MRSYRIVIVSITMHGPWKIFFAEDDDMIETLAPNRSPAQHTHFAKVILLMSAIGVLSVVCGSSAEVMVEVLFGFNAQSYLFDRSCELKR